MTTPFPFCLQVGSYYKTPRLPVWVICSESHFSVLFSLKRNLLSDWKAERNFDLYYYDGLSNQEEAIRLSVSKFAYVKSCSSGKVLHRNNFIACHSSVTRDIHDPD